VARLKFDSNRDITMAVKELVGVIEEKSDVSISEDAEHTARAIWRSVCEDCI
jgi:predicted transcriptional regulator